ncbi:dihydrodipicolinate synthase family protein [Meiothermus sp.]|jgi:dihydrodipicolinate synthase/N-acetylneuraminate lyase|uniref:dihydrodipicolinate synthase family protein n=1 Tax=Meiothermus sp. TaxID=1955249 RepID=UPI0021DE1D68|nr:dihydrodipicolinate synthase family protein [Meiothermus sp.]GIW26583.1 MAG: dihydrodipicolinate synthase family protein [Meiothermus sp.]
MIIPPLPTPFDQNGHLDAEAFRDLAQAIEPHVDGLLFYGSNGEGVHLTREERAAGLAIQTPQKPAMVGLMEETLAQAAIALSEAESLGAKVLVTPPRYYEANLGHDGLLRYFGGIADMGKAEVWLYHVPANTKAPLPLPVVAELSQHPNIGGLKDSSGELARMAFYTSQKLALKLYTGHAPTFLGALGLGAQGGILAVSNLAPKPYKEMLKLWQAGKVAEAQALQAEVEPFGRILAQGGFVLLKQALRHLGLPGGYPRPPYPSESPVWPAFKPLLEEFRARGWTVG